MSSDQGSFDQGLPAAVTLNDVRERLARHTPARMSERYFRFLNGKGTQPAHAAVLCALVAGAAGPEVVLTRRVESLRHHAGQVSFPGGRMDDSDDDLTHTALREAHEEIGLPPDAVTPLGQLDERPTITGFRVTPVVGLVHRSVDFRANPGEVAHVFQVPLAWLFDPRNVTSSRREIRGQAIEVYRFDWQGEKIWGATAQMIMDFKRIVAAP